MHIPLLLIIAATAVSAMGAIQQGKAASESAKAQANAANYNATIQSQNATIARQQSNAREEAQRRASGQTLGKMRASIAQSGTGLSGSNADVYEQSAAAAELDALNIRYEGELDARGMLAQSQLSKYEAKTHKMNAASARQGSYWSAAGSLLAGATKAYGAGKGGT